MRDSYHERVAGAAVLWRTFVAATAAERRALLCRRMGHTRLVFALNVALGLAPTTQVAAQDGASGTFAAPVRLRAGEAFLGENRLFPSPVFYDVDGDGQLDVVVGDLIGKMTVALRKPGKQLAFAAETKLMAADGKEIDFHNW